MIVLVMRQTGDELKINWICRLYAYEEEMVLVVIYKHAYPM